MLSAILHLYIGYLYIFPDSLSFHRSIILSFFRLLTALPIPAKSLSNASLPSRDNGPIPQPQQRHNPTAERRQSDIAIDKP